MYGGYSHVDTNSTQEGKGTYYTRLTGREGNKIYEYVYWMLKAIADRKRFKATYSIKLGNPPRSFERGVYSKIKFPYKPEPYPHDLSYYKPHKELIKKLLGLPPEMEKCGYDTVVHLRLDDVDRMESYSLMPYSYYKENVVGKTLIIGHPINESQEKYIRVLGICLGADVRMNGTIEEDLDTLCRCKRFVGSTSTFWAFPVMLYADEVIAPDFGVCKLMKVSCLMENGGECIESDDCNKK